MNELTQILVGATLFGLVIFGIISMTDYDANNSPNFQDIEAQYANQ